MSKSPYFSGTYTLENLPGNGVLRDVPGYIAANNLIPGLIRLVTICVCGANSRAISKTLHGTLRIRKLYLSERMVMKNLNIFLISLLLLLFIPAMTIAQTARLKSSDINRLTGTEWKGTLTYVDYRSGKKTSIASNLSVRPGADKSSWEFDFQYPDEPKANKKSAAILSPDGRTYDGETVIKKTKLDSVLKIVTTQPGTDNDKKAVFRFTYLIASSTFSIKKEVRYENTTEYFERNEYSWKR